MCNECTYSAASYYTQVTTNYLNYMKRHLLGIFASHEDATKLIEKLENDGVPKSSLSCIYVNDAGNLHDDQGAAKVELASAVGAGAGATVGLIAGLVVAEGVLPGLGALVVAGPLAGLLGITTATAVAGIAAGAVAGGLVGALSNFGLSTEDATLYESLVRGGGTLVIVHDNTTSSNKNTFEKMGGKEVREYSSNQ